MNTELMSKDLTIEYNESAKEITIKDANYVVERITSERDNKFGNPIFDIPNWNGFCSISKTMRGDHFNLFLKLNNKYYRSFQKIDENPFEYNNYNNETTELTIFRNFNEVEKVNGRGENIN